MTDKAPENASSLWVHLCVSMTQGNLKILVACESFSMFSRKLYNWWGKFETHLGCELFPVFPGKLYDWQGNLKMCLGSEFVSFS